MKANLRGKIREFLASEEGKVVVKAPLSLGIVSGTFLLTQVIFASPVSANDRYDSGGNDCLTFCEKHGEELSCTVVCA
ncbi:hypothetical protein F4Y59_02265 [Candidatus Poribacteria bacterium]|nr:hypothetical protein [Candidatus Poribacteria bacterium]MXY26969.1 hypothetical protein [Candidatus Poribacteria bacterium]MYK17056.1 hypothetical protein [Candidatus Poribacteria bacterium]